MTNKRFKPEIRKEEILKAALVLANDRGYANVTRDEIADMVGISGPAVQYHFSTMKQLRRELMRYAVKVEHLHVVAQGVSARDAQALKAPEELRCRALQSLM